MKVNKILESKKLVGESKQLNETKDGKDELKNDALSVIITLKDNEFKLASNSSLAHVFTQVEIYEAANCSEGSLVIIFFFSEEEYVYANNVVRAAGYEDMIDESIYLIDCRNDNKVSASKA